MDDNSALIPIFGIMIPIVGTIVSGLVIIFLLYFRHRERAKLHDTLRALAQTNSPHQDALMGALTKSTEPAPERDLRMAVIFLSTGVAFLALAFLVGVPDYSDEGYEVVWPMVAVAIFPLALGVGRLILYRLANKRLGD